MKARCTSVSAVLAALLSTLGVLAQSSSFEKVVAAPIFSIDGMAKAGQVAPDQGATVFASNALIGALGDADMLLLRVNGAGTIVQNLAIGDAGGQGYHDVAKEIVQAGKHYYVTGYTRAIDTSAAHTFTSFLIKVDTALNFVWQKNYILQDREMYAETMTPYGPYDLLISGKIYEGGSFHSFVMRTDSAGTPVWIKKYEMPLGENIECVRRLSNGDILMSGAMIFSFELVLPFVCKLDAEGNFLWGKYYNYPPGFIERSSFQFIHVSSMDDIQLAGYTDKFTPNATTDLFVVDIDSSGAVNWARTYGGPQFDEPSMVQFDNAADELVLVGASGSFAPNGAAHPFVARIALDGDLVGAALYGDTSIYQNARFHHSSRVGADQRLLMGSRDFPADDLYLVGTNAQLVNDCEYHPVNLSMFSVLTNTEPFGALVTVPEPIVNDSALTRYGFSNETWLCDQPTPVEGMEDRTTTMTLFPVPGDGTFQLTLPDGSVPAMLQVTNLMGQQMWNSTRPDPRISLPSELGTGYYLVQVIDTKGRRFTAPYELR